jgi:hypothetical protein
LTIKSTLNTPKCPLSIPSAILLTCVLVMPVNIQLSKIEDSSQLSALGFQPIPVSLKADRS